MKGRFASDGVFMEGVFEVGVFVCFILAFLRDRFGERRREIQNKTDNTVPQHFNHSEQQLKDTKLIPMELINNKREPISRARERFYIEKAQTMQPQGINREDNR